MPHPFGIVGRVVGRISAVDPLSAGVGSGDLLSQGYDFAIGDMGFHMFPTDSFPYQRETVEFRKEQTDVAQTVGEQSLTGWWLRSQLSFHRGAGIRYLEVQETVLERYKEASGLDPWTPGEVTLDDAFAAAVGASIVDAVPGAHNGNDGVFILTSAGAVEHRTTAGTTTAMTEGGTATSITTSGSTFYVSVGNTIKFHDGTTTLATLWTHHGVGRTWQGVWWAKGRLFAVDDQDSWFSLSKAGGTTTAGDIFWTPGATAGDWSLTETPAYVLLGNSRDIYAVTLSSDGSVPALAAPVVVSQVPIGETISTLHYYLGFVLVATQNGLRVGQADTSDGTPVMALGPFTIEGDFSSCKRMASYGSLTHAVGNVEDYEDASLFTVNLSEIVSDLKPAWTARAELGNALATDQGATVDANGVTWCWVNSQIRFEDPSLAATGTLVTGQIRLGTLEPKLFDSVKLRAAGDGGTVSVSYILPDETTVFMYSLDVNSEPEADIGIPVNSPQESIGFQFTLSSDSGERPTLLGYQLRALPSPSRQRRVSVPLLLHDTERNRRGVERGYKGSAWDRLLRLEELEQSKLMVQYQDFRTGEAGIGLIDTIRFQATTPSKGSSTGFGGVAYVEIRKLD